MEHESDGKNNYRCWSWNNSKVSRKNTEGIGNQKKDRNLQDLSIIVIGNNTQNNQGEEDSSEKSQRFRFRNSTTTTKTTTTTTIIIIIIIIKIIIIIIIILMKEHEKKDKYLDLARELKKTMEHKGDSYTNRDWCFWYVSWRIIKGPGGFGSWRPSGDYPNNSIIKRPVYWDESWRLEETCCHPISCEKLSAYTDVKTSIKLIIIIIIIIHWFYHKKRTFEQR